MKQNTEISHLKDINCIQTKKNTFELEKLKSESNQLKSEIE